MQIISICVSKYQCISFNDNTHSCPSFCIIVGVGANDAKKSQPSTTNILLVVDFSRHRSTTTTPVNSQGLDSEIVESHKYLGVHLNKNKHNKRDRSHNTDALYREGFKLDPEQPPKTPAFSAVWGFWGARKRS